MSNAFTRCMSGVLLCVALVVAPVSAQQIDPAWLNALQYRPLGPQGNRADAIVGVPGNPLIDFVGAASGGIFKTVDGGVHWTPVFDKQDAMSIGSLAIAPSAPNIVWAGTGEAFYIRNSTSIGNGIYKSTDGGVTWTHMGLDHTGRIARIVVDPQNPDVVFAAAVGSGFGPSPDRGVFRTTDGGKTWTRVLFVNENTGAADVAIDPHDPQTLLAGMWQLNITTWNLGSGGPGSGVYLSHDGGTTWTHIEGHGLPTHAVGKIAVGIAPSDGQRMYALIQDAHPGFYRSDNGGRTWRLMTQQNDIAERAPYYTRFAIDPSDENRLYFVSVSITMSDDGGATVKPFGGGGDNHDFWIDPTNHDRMMIAHDGGASITLTRGKQWQPVNLPIAQIYHVYADDAVPYFVYGNQQDNGSWRISSNPWAGGIGAKAEVKVGGCESGFTVPDTTNNEIAYSGCYDGGLDRFDVKTMQTRDVKVWPEGTYGWAPADVKYRWNWTFPIAISPNDHHIVYVGSQYVHETTDGGASWKVISPDLTRNDKSHQQSSGGPSTDNLYTFDGSTLWSIAESPKAKGLIWAGSNDGLLHVTRDGGAHWTDVSPNIPGLPHWATISNVEPSHFAAGTAYIAADDHMQGNNAPLIYETTDYGATWKPISRGIPTSVFSYVACVKEDPKKPGLLFAATQNSVYVTLDDGAHWTMLQSNLPHAPASWLAIQPRFGDLLVSTYGRGIWAMDDISPLRELTSQVLDEPAHLFTLRPAYRWRAEGGYGGNGFGGPYLRPPQYGADINYYLKAGGGPVTVAIVDASGKTIRTLKGTDRAGLNRVYWDLRYEGTREPLLLTPPPDAPWVETTTKGRRIRAWDLDLSYAPPLAPPGTYTVKVTADGHTLEQKLEVLKDPRSAGTPADITAQVHFSLGIRDAMDRLAGLIGRTEWVRRQLAETQAMLAAAPDEGALVDATKALEDKALKVESAMFDVHLTGAREDQFRNPMKLWGRLGALNREITEDSADFAPTAQQQEVMKLFTTRLEQVESDFNHLVATDVAGFNHLMQQHKLGGISVPPASAINYAPPRERFRPGDLPQGAELPEEGGAQ
ncbi:MAG TPA: hypothetical protein VND92_01760 [Vicinamibacterales bacterium]|nr:hypothetical protein [Vicinamibacterales bacterium]